MHGEGCSTLLGHGHGSEGAARTVGVYLAEAGIIFHSGPSFLAACLKWLVAAA